MNDIFNEIKEEINNYISNNIDNMFYSMELHNNSQIFIAKMAKKYNLISIVEYKLISKEKSGYIDVV